MAEKMSVVMARVIWRLRMWRYWCWTQPMDDGADATIAAMRTRAAAASSLW